MRRYTEWFAFLTGATMLFLISASQAAEPAEILKDRSLLWDKTTVYPKNVQRPNPPRRNSQGGRTVAVIVIDGKEMGEIGSMFLPLTPDEHVQGDIRDDNEVVKHLTSESIKFTEGEMVAVTKLINIEGTYGKPYVRYSLYFPHKDKTLSFQLMCPEKNLATLIPYFEKTLLLQRAEMHLSQP